ncbi:leucyl aminopeptidase family protein [Pelagibacterium sediminicola]|uniref:leucyl aminopeptidase family protein n=1 Tax=Pelagibacterium sediminicola TaxID=2248761 RepID=UPI000E30F32C|nr:leucyl aminopeptidase family protein [Pelagibacterium sediminicola]
MTATRPITCIFEDRFEATPLEGAVRQWAKANGFGGQQGKLLALPGADGTLKGYLFGMGASAEPAPLVLGLAAAALVPSSYRLEGDYGDPTRAALAFALGAYRFGRYASRPEAPVLELPEGADGAEVARLTEAGTIARNLINTPANDLGPEHFEAWVRHFARARKMEVTVIAGDTLIDENFPMIHAVGRASAAPPRLIDLSWGQANHPKLTLVGKGVTFDTGGLNIKPGSGMALMKKDMGGAANVLGLAHAIIDARLKVRLRVLLPIVENAISGASFRPGDVLQSRKGLTVEIGNTDAEGRLILADALALADEENPDLIIDMATLTGAARIALGPELPPLYARNEELGRKIVEAGLAEDDPVWPMPLWKGYEKMLASKIADVNHITSAPMAGSVTAALFLQKFVDPGTDWVHLDIFGWAPEARPGRPFGGTDQGIRSLYAVLREKYGTA